MKKQLLYSAACAAAVGTVAVQAAPVYTPVYVKQVVSGMPVCTQFSVDPFVATAMTTGHPAYKKGHCVLKGYPIAAPRPPALMKTPGGYVSGRLFTKVARDEMYDEDDDDFFQGAGAPTRPGLPIFGGDDDDFMQGPTGPGSLSPFFGGDDDDFMQGPGNGPMQGPGNASPFGPFGGDDDDDINVGKVKGIVDKFKKIKGMFDKNDDDDDIDIEKIIGIIDKLKDVKRMRDEKKREKEDNDDIDEFVGKRKGDKEDNDDVDIDKIKQIIDIFGQIKGVVDSKNQQGGMQRRLVEIARKKMSAK